MDSISGVAEIVHTDSTSAISHFELKKQEISAGRDGIISLILHSVVVLSYLCCLVALIAFVIEG